MVQIGNWSWGKDGGERGKMMFKLMPWRCHVIPKTRECHIDRTVSPALFYSLEYIIFVVEKWCNHPCLSDSRPSLALPHPHQQHSTPYSVTHTT